jgi:hypothetical protein
MGRYDGEDYADESGYASKAMQDAYRRAKYICNQEVRCPEGHFVGRCDLPKNHYGQSCKPTHPTHGFAPRCGLVVAAEQKHKQAVREALKLLRSEGYTVAKQLRKEPHVARRR